MDSEGKRSIKVSILGKDGSPSVSPLRQTLLSSERVGVWCTFLGVPSTARDEVAQWFGVPEKVSPTAAVCSTDERTFLFVLESTGMEKEQKVPEGGILRDDGCVCPPPPPPPECKSKLLTCPPDPRFPNTNQTQHCYYSFVDYQRCARLLGDYPGCLIFYKCYTSLCPRAWWERWYEQMENGTFPRKIYPPKPIIRPDPAKMRAMCYEEDPEAPPQPC